MHVAYEQSRPLARSGAKRLMHEHESQVQPSHLAQIMDVDIYLRGNDTRELPNMRGYPVRSLQNAISHIELLREHGLTSVVMRLGGRPRTEQNAGYVFEPLRAGTKDQQGLDSSAAMIDERLAHQVDALKTLRAHFPAGVLDITGDPFGIAPNSDGSWGLPGAHGQVDYEQTLELLERIAVGYSNAGVDGILTLGRVEGEVAVTRRALDRIGSRVRIQSFSQNIESRSAYVYLDTLDIHHRDDQKILPGNLTEMTLRTLLDIAEGTDVVVVKPSDQLHLVAMTTQFLQNKQSIVEAFTGPRTQRLLEQHPSLRAHVAELLLDIDGFSERCKQVQVGTYTVSGLYYLQRMLEAQRGVHHAFCWVDELFKNIASIARDRLASIMDRNALWYLQQAAELGRPEVRQAVAARGAQ